MSRTAVLLVIIFSFCVYSCGSVHTSKNQQIQAQKKNMSRSEVVIMTCDAYGNIFKNLSLMHRSNDGISNKDLDEYIFVNLEPGNNQKISSARNITKLAVNMINEYPNVDPENWYKNEFERCIKVPSHII